MPIISPFPSYFRIDRSGGTIASLVGTQYGGNLTQSDQISFTFGNNVTAGNYVLVGITAYYGDGGNTPDVSNVALTGSATCGTVVMDVSFPSTAAVSSVAIFRIPVLVTGSLMVTYTDVNAAGGVLIGCAEFSNLNGIHGPAAIVTGAGNGTDEIKTTGAISTPNKGIMFYVGGEQSITGTTRTDTGTSIYESNDAASTYTGVVQFTYVNSSSTTMGDTRLGGTSESGWHVAYAVYPDANDTLLAWWKLDDGSGITTIDSSGNGYIGDLVNTPTWSTGVDNVTGHALTFVASSNEYVEITNSSTLADNLTNFTVMCWFKTTTDTSNAWKSLVVKSHDIGSGTGWYLQTKSLGQVGVYLRNSGGAVWIGKYSRSTYGDGNWHHLTMVVTGGNTVIGYIDGVGDDGETTFISDSTGTWTNGISNTENITIGTSGAGGDNFDGSIDDVRIYDYALSDAQVLDIYNAGAA